MATFDLEDVIQKGVETALNKNKINGKSITQWAAIGMKAPQWVSVKDRLPEDNRFVLVCNDDGKMMVAQYIDETCQWQFRYMAYDVDVWDDFEQGPICWWMPLPEPPEVSEND